MIKYHSIMVGVLFTVCGILYNIIIVGISVGHQIPVEFILTVAPKYTLPSISRIASSPHPTQAALINQIWTWSYPTQNCFLPCFAGLYPGSTKQDVLNFFTQYRAFVEKGSLTQSSYDTIGEEYRLTIALEPAGAWTLYLPIESERLNIIIVDFFQNYAWLKEPVYDFAYIFATYGLPDAIFISIHDENWLNINIIFVYDAQGFVIKQDIWYEQNALSIEDNIPLCLGHDGIHLDHTQLWIAPGSGHVIDEYPPINHEPTSLRYLSIEKLASVSIEEFANFFLEHPDRCFTLPSLIELHLGGYIP